MHLTRIRRNGYTELKSQKEGHALEKLPHKRVDKFIIQNCNKMLDKEIAREFKKMGFEKITQWNVRYRRRKLGIKKYAYGEVKKHKAWVRKQAIEKYGNRCELCSYSAIVETHHVVPKYKGGLHEISNLMVMCPNCHALVTRKKIEINSRNEISKVKKLIKRAVRDLYLP